MYLHTRSSHQSVGRRRLLHYPGAGAWGGAAARQKTGATIPEKAIDANVGNGQTMRQTLALVMSLASGLREVR